MNTQAINSLEALYPQLPDSSKKFARSLLDQYKEKGRLSERQWPYVEKLVKEATQPKKVESPTPVPLGGVNTKEIIELFETAQGNGIKKPFLLLGDEDVKLKLSLATSQTSRWLGQIYVILDDSYVGRINPTDGRFTQVVNTHVSVVALLNKFTENPAEQARLYGKRTGVCCCCGRELTNPASIEAGIGPICADGWGF